MCDHHVHAEKYAESAEAKTEKALIQASTIAKPNKRKSCLFDTTQKNKRKRG